MSRRELQATATVDKMLDKLIQRFGFESEPTLYFAKWAYRHPSNAQTYFDTAMNWHFEDEDEDF